MDADRAGAVKGRKMTWWPSPEIHLQNAGADWIDQEVVVDRGLVSSRNPGDIPAFNRKVIEEFAEGGTPATRRARRPKARIPPSSIARCAASERSTSSSARAPSGSAASAAMPAKKCVCTCSRPGSGPTMSMPGTGASSQSICTPSSASPRATTKPTGPFSTMTRFFRRSAILAVCKIPRNKFRSRLISNARPRPLAAACAGTPRAC